MHFVLRSSRATGSLSFRRPANERMVRALLETFTRRNGIKILDLALPGNHIHLHLKLRDRRSYKAFIRAFTAAIALRLQIKKFWDRRPFSRIVKGRRDFLGIKSYLRLNALEASGMSRKEARFAMEWEMAERHDRAHRHRRPAPG